MSIRGIKKVNDEVVKAVKLSKEDDDPRPVKGRDLFPEAYSNIFFVARKKSGKTNNIHKIIDKCTNPETRNIIAFVSTVDKDPIWKAIKKMCKERGIQFTGFTSIKDDFTKEDILAKIVFTLIQKAEEEELKKEQNLPTGNILDWGQGVTVEEREKKKPKEKAPEIIFVFDDMSGQLQTPSVTCLLKMNRHFKTKVIISTQYWNDLAVSARRQVDYCIMYKGFGRNLSKLQEIYSNLDLTIPFETFVNVYRFCTREPFNFLYIDCITNEFRQNYTHKIEIDEDEDREA